MLTTQIAVITVPDVHTCKGSLLMTFVIHRRHHFICKIIQQYAHLHRYNLRRAGQQGPFIHSFIFVYCELSNRSCTQK